MTIPEKNIAGTMCVILCILVISLSLMCIGLRRELTEAKISRDLWHDHAVATANWRMDNYSSDYSYLTSSSTRNINSTNK